MLQAARTNRCALKDSPEGKCVKVKVCVKVKLSGMAMKAGNR